MSMNDLTMFDNDELLALLKLDLDKGEFEKALSKIKQLVQSPSAPAEAFAIAARIYAQLGLFERAKDYFKRYLDINPSATIEHFQMGMAHFDSGQVDEAIAIWSGILAKDPINPPALFYSGLAFAQTGKTADARHVLDTLLQSAPADNLYFTRAKDLLAAINNGHANNRDNGAAKESVATMIPKDAYKVEH